MPVDERTSRPCEPVDILNGGASLALAETVAGYGSIPLCEPGQMPCGIQISANHVHMVPIGDLRRSCGKTCTQRTYFTRMECRYNHS